MNLHRASEADYLKKPYHELDRNGKVAKVSKGILTVANLVSLVGAVSSIKGAREVAKGNVNKGAKLMAFGRLCDVADGYVADYLGTKGPTGELVDASLDKLVMGVTAVIFFKHNVIRRKVLAGFALQNLANVALTAVAKSKGNEIHPSLAGKLSTAGMWGEFITEVIAKDLSDQDRHEEADLAYKTANVLTLAAGAMGAVATNGYRENAFAINQAFQEAA